jgi:hypothetical protein
MSTDVYAKVQIMLASDPIFTRVTVDGKLLPVMSVVTESSASRRDESCVVLTIPMRFVELEQDR